MFGSALRIQLTAFPPRQQARSAAAHAEAEIVSPRLTPQKPPLPSHVLTPGMIFSTCLLLVVCAQVHLKVKLFDFQLVETTFCVVPERFPILFGAMSQNSPAFLSGTGLIE